jgi:uncharacterized protein (TIGR02231 family)
MHPAIEPMENHMKTFLILALALSPVLYAQQDDDGAKAVASKITEVTVYPDRARVTRAGTVDMPADVSKIAFRKLPGWLDEGSVRVGLSNGDVLDVQILKTFLARADNEEIRKAETAVQEISDQMASLDDERNVLDARSRQIDSIRVFSLEKLPKDAAVREVKVEEYGGVVKFVSDSMLEVAQARRELDRKRRELQPELNARQRKLSDLRQRSQLEQRTIVVTVKGTGKPVTATLTYMLPGATWEPMHEVRAENGSGKVAVASFAMITQTTGEDWDSVALSVSTQRSTDTIRIPEVEAMMIGGGRSLGKAMSSANDTFSIANANYEGQFTLWNTTINAGMLQSEVDNNWRIQKGRQARNVQVFTVLQQQRGTTAHFPAAGKQMIRTDGRPVRVPIGGVQLTAQPKIVAAPEVSLNAVRIADLTHTGPQPLLPGKVQLFSSGAFLGTTDVDFVAPGESFSLFMGMAEQIKVSRTLDKKASALNGTGKRKRIQASFIVTAENFSDKEVALQLSDRVPVSETDDVRVLNVKIMPTAKPDNKGLFKWDVTLGPKQTKEFRLEYTLDYPSDYVERAQMKAAPQAGEGMPSAPNDSLGEKIQQLEMMMH